MGLFPWQQNVIKTRTFELSIQKSDVSEVQTISIITPRTNKTGEADKFSSKIYSRYSFEHVPLVHGFCT
jgi:hypothetical protein